MLQKIKKQQQFKKANIIIKLIDNKVGSNPAHSHHSQDHLHFHDELQHSRGLFSAVVILVAMGIHGFFGGLALGVMSSLPDLIQMLLALMMHK